VTTIWVINGVTWKKLVMEKLTNHNHFIYQISPANKSFLAVAYMFEVLSVCYQLVV